MRAPRCISKLKPRTKDRRGKHTKQDKLARLRAIKHGVVLQRCRSCTEILDPAIRTEEGDALVCTACGVVDDNLCFDHEAPLFSCLPHSPLYKHKNYFAEKLLQARNKEPRLTDKELDIFSIVYDIYRRHCPLLWSEEYFSKKHAGRICRLITKQYPKSVFCRRLERWFQFRTYICGNVGNQLPSDVAHALRLLFDAYSHFFLVYLDRLKITRRNITQLDLVILVLLYNISYEHLNAHGWYFLNHNILNKTPSARYDMIRIKEICNLINDNILSMKTIRTIHPSCYHWFSSGRRLRVPSLTVLTNMALNNPMGHVQYVAYKGSIVSFL